MGRTISLIADSWEEALEEMKKQVETTHGIFAQDVILLNPETDEVKIYRPNIIDEEYNYTYTQISPEEETRGLIGVTVAGIFGEKPRQGQWIAICYVHI